MTAQRLRSRNWFGRADLDGFVHRSWLKTEGFSDAVFDGRPVVGIANSWSELTNCNAHLRQVPAWRPRPPHFTRGYGRLFLDHVLQAHEGCDFDFLRGATPVRFEETAGPSHA
jgi:hypothetical protein